MLFCRGERERSSSPARRRDTMIRRRFMQGLTLAGAGGLAGIRVSRARGSRTVTYRVKGFSCVTCAVGLETMLRREKGIGEVHATYPDGKTTIEFDPSLIDENRIRESIADKGFQVE